MQEKEKGSANDRGVVVQETKEGQCKRQGSCSARERRGAVQETGE